MKRALLYLLVGTLAYGGFLLVKFPAAVGYALAQKGLQPVALGGIEGTAWSGRAMQVSYRRRPVGAVDWSVRPFSLLLGGLSADIALNGDAGELRATATGNLDGSVLVEGAVGDLDVAELAPWLGLQGFRPSGRLQLRMERVAIRDGRPVQAAGELVWRQARINAPRPLALGGVTATVSTTPQGIRAVLRDRDSPFALDAVVIVQANGSYRLSGTLSARPDAPPEVHGLMQTLGVRQRGGSVPLNFRGRL